MLTLEHGRHLVPAMVVLKAESILAPHDRKSVQV